jgi:hypothetical protein
MASVRRDEAMTNLRATAIMKTDLSGSTARFRALPEPDLTALLTQHRELYAPQRLDRLDHRVQPPTVHRLVQFALQAVPPLLLLGGRAQVLLEDVLLRRGRAHQPGQPAEIWAGFRVVHPS